MGGGGNGSRRWFITLPELLLGGVSYHGARAEHCISLFCLWISFAWGYGACGFFHSWLDTTSWVLVLIGSYICKSYNNVLEALIPQIFFQRPYPRILSSSQQRPSRANPRPNPSNLRKLKKQNTAPTQAATCMSQPQTASAQF